MEATGGVALGPHGAAQPPDVAFDCPICLCAVARGDAFTLTACQHRFCSDCASAWVATSVADGHPYIRCTVPVPNPELRVTDDASWSTTGRAWPVVALPGTCGRVVTVADVESLLRRRATGADDAAAGARAGTGEPASIEARVAAALARYRRLKAAADDPNSRECPFCGQLQVGPGTGAPPEMACTGCRRTYCFLHSNAHDGQRCADYVARIAPETRATESALAAYAKHCPRCGVYIQKTECVRLPA